MGINGHGTYPVNGVFGSHGVLQHGKDAEEHNLYAYQTYDYL